MTILTKQMKTWQGKFGKDYEAEMRIVAIVQVRMGSSRLPGKVMKKISTKPMLWHILQRLKRSKLIDEIIVATTRKKADHIIIELAQGLRLNTYAGSEENVLDRYYRTARKYRAEVVVRITSDCPLIDPHIIDKVIAAFLEKRDSLDYINQGRTYPAGCAATEVFSFDTLQKAWWGAKSPYEREHVTPYIYWNPHLFRIGAVEYERDLSHLKLTVDYQKDLELVREIFRHLYFRGNLFHLEDVVRLLEHKPELLAEAK